MTMLRLREGETQTLALTVEEAWWLQDLGVATCRATRVPGRFSVEVANVVGLASMGSSTVQISPRLPVGELMWLVVYAATGLQLTPRQVQAFPTDLPEAIAQILLSVVGEAVSGGAPRGYWDREETSPTLRGRLRLTDQITQHLGRMYPLEIVYPEFGVDIPENQIMRAACWSVLGSLVMERKEGTAELQARLRRLLRSFDGVTPLTRGARIPAWKRTPQNAKAWTAIALSELVLTGGGLDVVHGDRASIGMIIEVGQVFADAVVRGLQEVRPAWTVSAGRRYPLVAGHPRLTMRPALVIEEEGAVLAVGDTKYDKPSPGTEDVYRLATYAQHLGLTRSQLIHASPRGEARRLPVGSTGVEIITQGVALDRASADFLDQLAGIADAW